MKKTVEHREKKILEIIQAKSQVKALEKLDWNMETVLNAGLINELSKLKKMLLKKRRTEPKPAIFMSQPQQPPSPLELDFEFNLC